MAILSEWGEKLDVRNPLPEYPRPQLVRDNWTNLNGIWEYQIVLGEGDTDPNGWKEICVPFALGSVLSGAEHELQPYETVWYRRTFAYKPTYGKTLLHFEAVDQSCTVYLNGVEAGNHHGGYTPFTVDITRLVKYQNALMVKVTDRSDDGIFAFGKQRLKKGGIWYTPTAGIWGTVWMEEVGPHSIDDIKITPDYDSGRALIEIGGPFEQAKIVVSSSDGFHHEGLTKDGHYEVPMADFHPWSPEDPFLYQVEISSEDDSVKSYFGMRKFTCGKDAAGFMRFFLNDKPLFLSGLLDQGITIDGMYTYASDDAIRYEIETAKRLGFNMLRKHVKIESRRWYYLCDTIGMLVMQDMPNGGRGFSPILHQALPLFFNVRNLKDTDHKRFGRENPASRKMYMHELSEMLDMLYNSVCIFAWVPFNEGWGQFDSEKVTDEILHYDATRLIDSASGWHDQGCGDFLSMHVYFKNFKVPKLDQRVLILSEFGGYSYLEYGHANTEKLFGYKKFTDKLELDQAVNRLFERDILRNIDKGLSGCVYTQLTDVETECNGLLTADRKVLKIDERKMKKMNEKMMRRMTK